MTTRQSVKPAMTPMLSSATDAVAASVAATVRRAIATAMLASIEGRMKLTDVPKKKHWPMLRTGHSLCRPRGSKRKGYKNPQYADRMEDITCEACRKLLPGKMDNSPAPEAPFQYFEDMGKLLDEETAHADKLAEALRFLFNQIEEDQKHLIAVTGAQITVGDIVEGVLSAHSLRRTSTDA